MNEIFMGEAGFVTSGGDKVNGYAPSFLPIMHFIVTVGWSLYTLSYFLGYLNGTMNSYALNLVCNLADFIDKVAFCLAIWSCAKSSTLAKKGLESR